MFVYVQKDKRHSPVCVIPNPFLKKISLETGLAGLEKPTLRKGDISFLRLLIYVPPMLKRKLL